MQSAICFNLDQSKILSSGNGVSVTVDFVAIADQSSTTEHAV